MNIFQQQIYNLEVHLKTALCTNLQVCIQFFELCVDYYI